MTNLLTNLFVTNWKTTAAGILAVALGVATYTGIVPDPKLTALITSILAGTIGVTAKDA